MFLRPHIAAETLGVVPPRHHLEDARPGGISPGLQLPEARGIFDEAQTLPERALKNLRALRKDGNLAAHDEATVAVLVSEPLVGAVTVKVILLTWPLVNVPKVQLTTPLLFNPPPVALTNVTLAGNVSVTTTLLAADGPKFVTEIV